MRTCLLAAVVALFGAAAGLAETVSVHLASGRTFHGLVDPRTDDVYLWLRSTYGRAVILRPIEWSKIAQAEVAGVTQTPEQFRQQVVELKQRTPQRYWPEEPRWAVWPAATVFPCPPVVLSLEAAVESSNWDSDADADGYTLCVMPLAAHGAVLAVEGTVEATLHGYETTPSEPHENWTELARWSQRLTFECYGPAGGLLRLPLDAMPNELAYGRSPRRVLRLRLNAPGHGTFEAEVPILAVRPY